MKQVRNFLCVSIMLCVASLFSAEAVASIALVELGLAQGGTAEYDASEGTIMWSGGASGKVILSDQTVILFEAPDAGVTISADIAGGTPSGTSATFSSLDFTLTYAPFGQTLTDALIIEGSLGGGTYDEVLSGPIPGLGAILNGSAVVNVTSYSTGGGSEWAWIEASGSSLETSMVGVQGFTDYNSQDYLSNNLKILIKGSNFVPEPATMALLACGAMGLLNKRRKK